MGLSSGSTYGGEGKSRDLAFIGRSLSRGGSAFTVSSLSREDTTLIASALHCNTKAAIAAFGGRAVLRGVLFVQVGLCSATGVGPWAQPHVDYYYCSSLSWAAGYWIKQYVSASAVPPLTGGGRGNVCGVVRPLSGLGSALGRGVHQVCPQDTRGPAGGGRRAAAAHHHGCDAGVVPGQGQGQGGISV